MADVWLVKRGGMFFPADDDSRKACKRIAHGEMANCKIVRPRNVKFHRKWWALVTVAFDAWEPAEDYKGEPIGKSLDAFRRDLIVLTGRRRVVASLNGSGVRYEAESIAFANMDEDEFSRLYSETIDVILKHILRDWDREGVEEAVENVLRFAA